MDARTTTVIPLGEAEDVLTAFCEFVGEGAAVGDMVDEPGDMMGKPAFCRSGVVTKAVAGTKATFGQLEATTPPTEMHPGSWGMVSTNPISSSGMAWVYVQASAASMDWLVILNNGHLSLFPAPRWLHLERICAQAPVWKPLIKVP